MRVKPTTQLLFLIFFLLITSLTQNGCSSDQAFPEEPLRASSYYWPWISHGQLYLSNGELIMGPDLFESETGFIAEFTEDYNFNGQLVWLVEECDVFALEWVTLSFNVDFYDQNEWEFELNYEFEIENLQPEPGDDGIQEFAVNLVDQQQGFEVRINKILLGKEQEASFSTGPINYVALEMEINVISNP